MITQTVQMPRASVMKKVNILNVSIDNLSIAELLDKLEFGGIVFTPNVDHLIKLQNNQDFLQAYSSATYKVCDSQILIYASKFLGTPIQEKICGCELFHAFYNYYKKNDYIKIFLLGAAEGVANKAKTKINTKVGRDIIVAAHSPSFGFEKNEKECLEIVDMINKSEATVLAIGVGAPKQEMWIYKYKDDLKKIQVFLAIGSAIELEAGDKTRSPKWMSNIGLEWFYRLLLEPRRLWKRYLIDDFPFLWLVLKQKFNNYKLPLTSD